MEAEITKPLYSIGESVVVSLAIPDASAPAYRLSEVRSAYWSGVRWEYDLYGVNGMIGEDKIINKFKNEFLLAILD